MGSWFTMGQLTPKTHWQTWSYTTTGELFRLRHVFTQDSWFRPRGIITQFWDDDEIKPGVRIWAKENSDDLIELNIPAAYQLSGNTLRKIGVLMFTPYVAVTPAYSWNLVLEVFDPNG